MHATVTPASLQAAFASLYSQLQQRLLWPAQFPQHALLLPQAHCLDHPLLALLVDLGQKSAVSDGALAVCLPSCLCLLSIQQPIVSNSTLDLCILHEQRKVTQTLHCSNSFRELVCKFHPHRAPAFCNCAKSFMWYGMASHAKSSEKQDRVQKLCFNQ